MRTANGLGCRGARLRLRSPPSGLNMAYMRACAQRAWVEECCGCTARCPTPLPIFAYYKLLQCCAYHLETIIGVCSVVCCDRLDINSLFLVNGAAASESISISLLQRACVFVFPNCSLIVGCYRTCCCYCCMLQSCAGSTCTTARCCQCLHAAW